MNNCKAGSRVAALRAFPSGNCQMAEGVHPETPAGRLLSPFRSPRITITAQEAMRQEKVSIGILKRLPCPISRAVLILTGPWI